ncbi:pyridoxal 5'-phosphate synthase [Kitasatospora sp. NBC_00240]|uniref:pyridoxine/pyridoxamine 5'-phosphate oxidase n=1 Tax=Kitasatospora sp. NBC_00240 TaxID=2903567 RepID=UPI0022582E06|nr:pyridoxal 5'-phosphate synthase [Kitasatospora sp. NBC_00240]MCX5208531.1 pyridoxal 5'-phosphate synthase [Kitasatospora sp. NBC_00240]
MTETTRNRFRAIAVFEGLDPKGFTTADLAANPLEAVQEWILAAAGAGQAEPHAMTLCTVGADGTPSSRVLLCKDIDGERLYFASHSDSRKGVELADNPRVAVQFHWPVVGRQLRLTGTATATDRAASEADFAERGRGSRLSAHLHRATAPGDREEVLAECRRLSDAHPQDIPCPPSWTLYGIVPSEVEFWEAGTDRVHTRVRCLRAAETLTGNGTSDDATPGDWYREYLWP